MKKVTVFALFTTVLTLALPPLSRGEAGAADPAVHAIHDALHPQFTPPAPGTYSLPPIDTVSDHLLLDSTGKSVSLFALTSGKIAVISFMYTACTDVGGCPLAAAVLQRVDHRLGERPELAKQVTLLSVSFDPERDTPARLAEVRAGLDPRTEWRFLTSRSPAAIQPILADFHQPVVKLWDEGGQWSGLFRHVLKVFLLDRHHRVRNIYSTGFFNPQLVLNDIETILLEEQRAGHTP